MKKVFSQEELNVLRQTFSNFDTDSNGLVGIQELSEIFHSLGFTGISQDQLQYCMNLVDYDKNNYLGFEEFLDFISLLNPSNKEQELQSIFQTVDTNANGVLEPEELRGMLYSMGHAEVTDEQVEDMLQLIDTNKNGVVEFNEFLEFVSDLL